MKKRITALVSLVTFLVLSVYVSAEETQENNEESIVTVSGGDIGTEVEAIGNSAYFDALIS